MNVREAAIKLLLEYEQSGKYVNLSLNSHVTDTFTREDKSFLTVLLYTTVERKLTFDYYISALSSRSIDSIKPRTRNILRLGLCQITMIDSVPDYAAVNETVKLTKNPGERSFVNGVLREAVRRKADTTLPMPEKEKSYPRYLSVRESFPLPLVRHFISLYGIEATENMLCAFNTERHTDLTVNTNKISRESFIRLLSATGISATPSPISSISVRIDGSVAPASLPGYNEGYFFVQDAASAIAIEALGLAPNMKCIDPCSAPGGKSFAAAILSHDEARIISSDIHESKLSLIESGAERLGLTSITVTAHDASVACDSLIGVADRVICDVPCSGLGVISKKPDLRYKDPSLDSLVDIQYSILATSAKYLKVGGRLLYSTCTLNPKENEENVHRFIGSNKDFRLLDFTVGDLSSDGGMLTLLPHIHNTDGFFISLTERVGNDEK